MRGVLAWARRRLRLASSSRKVLVAIAGLLVVGVAVADGSGAYDPMTGAGLSGTVLFGANLSGADLIGGVLTGANMADVNLSNANLTFANLSRADLKTANLSRAYLRGAHLEGAKLTRAVLTGADLSSADLTGAVLTHANLNSAFLRGANLTGANLAFAKGLTQEQLNEACGTGVRGLDMLNPPLTFHDKPCPPPPPWLQR